MICIPRTARYVVRNQAEIAEDAESTNEHQRIQLCAIFRFKFWRRNYMYTTNCQVCALRVPRGGDATPCYASHMIWYVKSKEGFHSHINTQTIFKFPDRLIGRRACLRLIALQQQSWSSTEIQPSTLLRIASLHLAETLRPTALPHGSAHHL